MGQGVEGVKGYKFLAQPTFTALHLDKINEALALGPNRLLPLPAQLQIEMTVLYPLSPISSYFQHPPLPFCTH